MSDLTSLETYKSLSVSTKMALLYKEVQSILDSSDWADKVIILSEFLYLINEVEALEKDNLYLKASRPIYQIDDSGRIISKSS